MSTKREHRPITAARSTTNNVANRIYHNIFQTVSAHQFSHTLGTVFFVKSRRFDFTELNLLAHCTIDVALGFSKSGPNLRFGCQLFNSAQNFRIKWRNSCHGLLLFYCSGRSLHTGRQTK